MSILAALVFAVEPVSCARLERSSVPGQISTQKTHESSSFEVLAPTLTADREVLHHFIEDLSYFQAEEEPAAAAARRRL